MIVKHNKSLQKIKRGSLNELSKNLMDKTKGLVKHNSPLRSSLKDQLSMYIDDSDLQALLDPGVFIDEASDYLRLRTSEKLIINQLQCFMNMGIKVLFDFIRQKLLETYIAIERQHKFKNRGLLFLLQVYDHDVTRMLSVANSRMVK